jgi:pimeloyl-ACP methyl ester carboxylesterase
VVLLHGNVVTAEDWVLSGVLDRVVGRGHRVVAFDRPGFGHSERPRGKIWSPEAQADLVAAALAALGLDRATVLGHSWGCSVAVALGRRHPDLVERLILASGYYYPTVRADVVGMSMPALPIVGDVLRYSVSPLLGRATWPLVMHKMFGPAPVPEKFEGFPKEMALRPSQIRASAAEAALMVPSAARAASYAELRMPVAIIAGEDDRLIDIDAQSARLHAELPQSTIRRVPGAGHMVHQTATDAVMATIAGVADPVPLSRAA